MSEMPTELPDPGQEALLYLAGELDDSRREVFERRLETDTVAQEQLAQAVELTEVLRFRTARPDPAYRDAVRSRVLPRASLWPKMRLSLEIALAIGLIGLSWLLTQESNVPEVTSSMVSVPQGSTEMVILLEGDPAERIDMASAWAEMSDLTHYYQTNEEDQRRRQRVRESGQLMLPTLMGEFDATLD